MKIETIKNQILILIGGGQMKEALAMLSTHSVITKNSQLNQNTNLLKTRLTDISRKKMLGLLSSADAKLKQNELGESILFLADDIQNEETSNESGE
jgi:Effector-associated domain 11